MKDAAAAWATAAMAPTAQNRIVGFSGNNARANFKDHFLEKFTLIVNKINGTTNSPLLLCRSLQFSKIC